ncbi:hypothetical protein [Paenibacillus sedimenti]|uniref:Uncharacterized protein n=1 Tax=Paenibacillus sedimenti TaxID=2770274 RepID=A0A926KK52_9BACL|nr:hypothetical protein [Paenibacillus sedimenti]MBD0379249.1 hypothetical protein [Paenibacillus sedimenti]
MREIDINHLMSQLGLSSVDFVRWQTEQTNHSEVEEPCIIETPVDSLAELSSGSSIELAY